MKMLRCDKCGSLVPANESDQWVNIRGKDLCRQCLIEYQTLEDEMLMKKDEALNRFLFIDTDS